MRLLKSIYYFILCYIFPTKLKNGIYKNNYVLKFKKERNKWYANIKYWSGFKNQLEMVGGADLLLNKIDFKNTGQVKILITDKCNEYYLMKIKEGTYGATYRDSFSDSTIWLCNVSKWFFGKHPQVINYSIIE